LVVLLLWWRVRQLLRPLLLLYLHLHLLLPLLLVVVVVAGLPGPRRLPCWPSPGPPLAAGLTVTQLTQPLSLSAEGAPTHLAAAAAAAAAAGGAHRLPPAAGNQLLHHHHLLLEEAATAAAAVYCVAALHPPPSPPPPPAAAGGQPQRLLPWLCGWRRRLLPSGLLLQLLVPGGGCHQGPGWVPGW
jgi:hypothetical protein